MEQSGKPKWQHQVEAILRKQFQDDKLSDELRKTKELISLTKEVEPPSGDFGTSVNIILTWASEDLYPLAATYCGFQLGVAYERYQNANRA